MKAGGADVRVLHTPQPEPYKNIVRMLRQLADDIEQGEDADIESVALIAERDDGEITVYGWGADERPAYIIGLLQMGAHRLARMQTCAFEPIDAIGAAL